MKKISLSILTVLLVTIVQAQTTYYVSLSGNNNNNGLSENTSWRTISYAVSASSPVNSGDTIYVKAGNYGLEDIFIDKNYSPNDARIAIIGYQNVPGDITSFDFNYGDNVDASRMPLLNPNDRTTGEGINLSDIYSITIKNIQIANCLGGISISNTTNINSNHIIENVFLKNIGWEYSTAISIKEGSNNTIQNCLIDNATGAGMDVWGNNNQVSNCKVYSNESQLITDGTYTSMDYYIVLKGNNNTVSDCYAERDGNLEDNGHGFEIKENGENNLFVNCTVKNMVGGCFSVRWSGVQNNEFRNCTALGGVSDDVSAFTIREGASYNSFNSCIADGCNAGVRFILNGEDADYCGEYNTFNNCIIKNADWVIDLNPYFYNSASANNNLLINCTIDTANYLFNCERPNVGNQFVNCIISNVPNFLIGDNTPTFTYQNCDFYNNGFAMPSGSGNISSNPLFVDQAAGNFHLQANSPCVDSGIATNAPTTDFDGTSRPQGNGFDIGAFEYSDNLDVNNFNIHKSICYPNPTEGIIHIKFSNENYQIVTVLGRIVQSGVIDSNSIDIVNLKNGVYFLKIKNNRTVKIIKE